MTEYGLRPGAEEFPLMIVISIIYPCNYGCPNCPYTDGNSEIRQFYHQRHGDLFPVPLWNKIADECGRYGAWMRCTGGGEPMLHPQMVSMIADAKARGARFWTDEIGVDEVITRKFLSWDDNTTISLEKSLDPHLYGHMPSARQEPCVWPFERINVDTLGRIALCGQDVSFRTSTLFPNLNDTTIKAIWQGERFNWYRRLHLEGRGAEAWPCRGCSAWLAGVRDWKHGWLKVLKRSGDHVQEIMRRDVGVEVDVYQPPAVAEIE